MSNKDVAAEAVSYKKRDLMFDCSHALLNVKETSSHYRLMTTIFPVMSECSEPVMSCCYLL